MKDLAGSFEQCSQCSQWGGAMSKPGDAGVGGDGARVENEVSSAPL